MGLVALLFAILVFPMACGGDDNIQRIEVPELSIVEPESGQINLEPPPDEDREQSQGTISIRNTGLATLRVTRLEMVNTPERLARFDRTDQSCSVEADCEGGQICLATGTCVELGLPATPLEFQPSDGIDLEFVLQRGSTEIICPEAPAEIAPEFEEFYCGEVIIETNAQNNAGVVENGRARILFLRPDTSGQIAVNPEFISFQQVQPGTSDSQDFSVQNVGSTPLTVTQISVTDAGNFFTITGDTGFPAVIEPQENATWTLNLEIPADAAPEDYVGFTEMIINSSAGNSSAGNIPIEVSADAAAAPEVTISESTLKFDQQASQTITIQNTGSATLIVSRLKVEPNEASAFYSFEIEGNDVTDTLPPQNIAKGDSLDLTINFDSTASTESSVGILTIGHNAQAQNRRSEVILLGDAGDVPIARVHPLGFTFLADPDNTSTRTFVLRNIGTAALDVSALALNFNQGSDAEFTVTGVPANVPPGGISTGTVTFTGANASPDVGSAVFATNDDVGEIALGLRDVASSGEVIVPQITPLFANDARVGAQLGFTAANSTPSESSDNALWTLLERPAGSEVFFFVANEELSFTPDVAGTYRFSLLLNDNQRESEEIYELTVVE